jgi:hypothetical protein
MESLVSASASRLQTSALERTLEQRQTLRAQIDAEQARAQNLRNEQRRAERADVELNESRLSRELIRDTTDAARINATRAQEFNDLRIQERNDRQIDDNLQALDDQLTREAIRDAFNPLPELQQNQATRPSNEIDDSLPVRTDEISLRELLVERNARLTDRAADEQAFAQQQSRDFERSVQAINTFVTQPGDATTFEERGGIVDFQA